MKNLDPSQHPCFNEKTRHENARIHLPVASRCNMQCNFCDRKYSCVNESRPGVTSSMLKPFQALEYLHRQVERIPKLSVVGIAGPGDPFANPDETLETFRLVREAYPDMLLCVATNGLGIEPYISDLVSLGLSHVTFTVNTIRSETGARIYSWMRYGKRTHHGEEAAKILWAAQSKGIQALSSQGVLVKVNTILIPGVNDGEIPEVAREVKNLGATIMNVMPLKPTANTVFAEVPEPDAQVVGRARLVAGSFLPQMGHCSRCRADAAGLIGAEQQASDRILLKAASGLEDSAQPAGRLAKPCLNVAVATMEGVLVNQHLGEARELSVYTKKDGAWSLLERRVCPEPGTAGQRWESLAEKFSDCSHLFLGGIGPNPREILEKRGLHVEVVEGLISQILESMGKERGVHTFRKNEAFECGSACSGNGTACG